jgi:hypothetical protein
MAEDDSDPKDRRLQIEEQWRNQRPGENGRD